MRSHFTLKIISLVLIPTFLFSNLTFAQGPDQENKNTRTLAPHSIFKLRDSGKNGNANLDERAERVWADMRKTTARSLAGKMARRLAEMRERGISVTAQAGQEILANQINVLSRRNGVLPDAKLIRAVGERLAASGTETAERAGFIAQRVAVVGDSERTRLVIPELVKNGIVVAAWAADTPPSKRLNFMARSATHDVYGPKYITIIGDMARENIVLKIGQQSTHIRPLVFRPGRGTKSSNKLIEVLAGMQVDTVVLDSPGLVDEEELVKRGIHVVVMDKEAEPDSKVVPIAAIANQAAFHIGQAFRELAQKQKKVAEVQFAQLKVIEPNGSSFPATHSNRSAAEPNVTQTKDYQKELREGLGISGEDGARVLETIRFGYPIPEGLIINATIAMNRDVDANEVRAHLIDLAKRDGFFKILEDDPLTNTRRVVADSGVQLYSEPLVQTTDDGRSLIQVSFIADPLTTQVEQLVQILQGKNRPRISDAIIQYEEIRAEIETPPQEAQLADALKTDLANNEVAKLAERFKRRWGVTETKRLLRKKEIEPEDAAFILFGRKKEDFTSFEFLEDAAHNRIGLMAISGSGDIWATTLLTPVEPEQVAPLQKNYYDALRQHAMRKIYSRVRDVYHPAERLSCVWQIESENRFILREVLQVQPDGADKVLSRPMTAFNPFAADELGVFVNGAGGRIGSEVARIIAGDEIDPKEGLAPRLSGKLVLIGLGVSDFEEENGRVWGGEGFVRLIRQGEDLSSGPFSGKVRHGHEDGRGEDWVELTDKRGKTVRVPVFSDLIFRNPENYPLVSFLFAGVPIAALDGTGLKELTERSGLSKYLWAGADRVTLPNPGASQEDHWKTHTFIYGVNDKEFHATKKMTSTASCTTAAAATLAKKILRVAACVLAGAELPDHLKDEYMNQAAGILLTGHPYTRDEVLGDEGNYDMSAKNQSRQVAKGAAYGGPTGAAKTASLVLPEVKATGEAIRGPWLTGSVLSYVMDVPGHLKLEDLLRLLKEDEAVKSGRGRAPAFKLAKGVSSSAHIRRASGELAAYSAVLDETHIQIVHTKDNFGRPRSIISTLAWYENEWGFSVGVARFLDDVVRPGSALEAQPDLRLDRFPERLSAIPEEENAREEGALYSDRVYLDQMSEVELERIFKDKTVFVKADYNIVQPVSKDKGGGKFEDEAEIIEDFRILATLSDIQRLRKAGAKIVLASHNGRFRDIVKNRAGYTLEPVAKRLSELLGIEVKFSPETVGQNAMDKVDSLKEGDVLLLENLRNNPAEEDGSPGYAEEIAETVRPDAYVFLAFGAAHRGKHASISPLIDYLRAKRPGIPVIGGGIIRKELEGLKKFLTHNKEEETSVAILGGAKIEDKIEVMRKLISNRMIDKIAVVGAMSFYFYLAKGYSVGNSFLDDNIQDAVRSTQLAFEIMLLAEENGVEIVLPKGYRGLLHRSIDKTKPVHIKDGELKRFPMGKEGLPPEFYAYSVDQDTVDEIVKMCKQAMWIIVNGTAGVVEIDAFRYENDLILHAVHNEVDLLPGTRAVILGGDGVAAFSRWAENRWGEEYLAKVQDTGYTLSTGGGASLEFLSRLVLSGLEPLDFKVRKRGARGKTGKIGLYGNLKRRIHTQEGLRNHLKDIVASARAVEGVDNIEVVIFVPSDLANDKELVEIVKGSPVKLGVQNIRLESEEDSPELTAEEAKALGFTHVMIGHSDMRSGSLTLDRRPQTNQDVNARLRATLKAGLIPLFLFGETLDARLREIADSNQRWKFIDKQLREGMEGVAGEEAGNILFGLEPVWAIGKQAASPFYANVQLRHARRVLADIFGEGTARQLALGYGGGTNERNIISYISGESDLVVPGRPSADARSFSEMITQTVRFSKEHCAGRSSTNGSRPARDSTNGLSAEAIKEQSTVPDTEALKKLLVSLGLYAKETERGAVIVAFDTGIFPVNVSSVLKAGKDGINRYLEGKVIDIRAQGPDLLTKIQDEIGRLKGAGIPLAGVVAIAGDATVEAMRSQPLELEAGKVAVINVQKPENRYIPVIGLYDLALRIVYNPDDKPAILECLKQIALNPDNKPFGLDDVEELLKSRIIRILPKIIPMDMDLTIREAYRAAQAALTAL